MAEALYEISYRITGYRMRPLSKPGGMCENCEEEFYGPAAEMVVYWTLGPTNKAEELCTHGPMCGPCAEALQQEIENGTIPL